MGNSWGKSWETRCSKFRTHPFFFSGETIFEDKPKEHARPGHVRSSSPKAGDFARFARFLLLSSSHFLRSLSNLFLSSFPNIPNMSSPTRNYFIWTQDTYGHICFPNVPYFPHKFSHVLKTMSSHRARSPAWSAWWSSAWPCRVTPWWEPAACGSLAAASRPTSCRSGKPVGAGGAIFWGQMYWIWRESTDHGYM